MKKAFSFILALALLGTLAVPAYASAGDANAAYNALMAAFGGRYPDEYAGAYLAGDQLCVLLTKRFADTDAKLASAQKSILSHVSDKNVVIFKTAKHSYAELLAARESAAKALTNQGYTLSFIGINDSKNLVEVGIDPKQHSSARAFIKSESKLSALPLSLVSAQREAPPVETTALYASEPVYLREGPGTKYKIITELKAGEAVELVGHSQKWAKVVWQGETGYVFAAYLTDRAMEKAAPKTYDLSTLTEGLKETFAQLTLIGSTEGNTLGFSDAPTMTKRRYSLPKKAGETLTVYFYDTAADMALCKSYIDGYALENDGMRVYAASNQPYTWYQDGKCAILLYCGTDQSIDKKLRAFTGNAPAGGYFAGDDWGKK